MVLIKHGLSGNINNNPSGCWGWSQSGGEMQLGRMLVLGQICDWALGNGQAELAGGW